MLKKDFRFSIPEIEDMMIFERDVYLDLIKAHIEELRHQNDG